MTTLTHELSLSDWADYAHDLEVDLQRAKDERDDAKTDLASAEVELDSLEARLRRVGHYSIEGAVNWLENADPILDTIARWHDEAHEDPRHFCSQEPCASLRNAGHTY